ncbi:MAG: Rap1a/Tai family immunity protein [Kiloniellales bacterium]|jgi:hypothetical protein|nr:Rap1a/Tai family immunity protein [Kiloniellales bacterium]
MKPFLLAGVFSVLLAFGSKPAISASPDDFRIDTAADLAALCGTSAEHELYAAAIHMCEGYLIGVHQMHTAVAAALSEGVYCLPSDNAPTRDEAAAGFAAYVAENPDVADLEALDALLTWASATYPCN